MTHSFTDNLRAEAEPTWSDAVQHRFIRELCDGSVPDAVMGAYLVQEGHVDASKSTQIVPNTGCSAMVAGPSDSMSMGERCSAAQP